MLKKSSILLLIACLLLSGCGVPGTEVQQSADTSVEVDSSAQSDDTGKATKKHKNAKISYDFRNPSLRTEHYKKHGIEMGFESVDAYVQAANDVISNPAALHKLEAEDDDHVYYIEATDEIVFLSQDGYIRTYFKCGGKDYFDRQ